MLSLDDFEYSAYNSDFGPLTVNDLLVFTSMMHYKKHKLTNLQVSTNYKK
jgi:hypothetical protein